MPFTLSHPSAALPLWPLIRRGYIPLAPFAIGAMAPDFEYLFRLEPYALVSHSARGIVTFCLPVGLVVYALWELLVQPTGRALVALPSAPHAIPRNLRSWMQVIVALASGSATHVGWDAFTHRDAWGPILFPGLKATAFVLGGYAVPWYNVLQMVSSIIGALVVLWWLRQEMVKASATSSFSLSSWRVKAWITLGAFALAVAAWNAPRQGIMTHITRTKLVLGRMAVGALVGIVIGLVALAILRRMGRFTGTDQGREQHA